MMADLSKLAVIFIGFLMGRMVGVQMFSLKAAVGDGLQANGFWPCSMDPKK
jgi:hypothetical protein